MRILIAEDDRKSASFIGKALQRESFLADSLNTGDEDYLLRPFALVELMARVHSFAQRPLEGRLCRCLTALNFVASLFLLAGCAHYEPKPVSLRDNAQQLEARSLTNESLHNFLLSFPEAPVSEWPPHEWDFELLNWATFYYHQSLELARSQWKTASASIRTAGGRPNPTIGITPGYNFSAISPTTPWIPGMTIDIPIETAGKRRKRMAQAELSSFAARYALDSAAWQVRSNLRSALIELTAAQRRDELLHNQLTNQARMTELLQQRLQAGAASASELLPVRLGVVRLQADAASAKTALLQARSHLAEVIGIPETGLGGARFRFEETTNNTLVSRTPELRALALQRRSDILSALAKYEASQAALQLEIAKQYPDIRLGSGYVWDQGESKWNLLLSMEIPLLNRNEGPIAEAEARRTEAAAQLLDVQARAIAEIDRSLSILAGSAEEIARISQVHATTSEQVTLAEQRLAAGAADQVEVQTLRIEESASALLLLDAQTRLKVAGGQLEDALQIPFKALAAVVPNIPIMKPQAAGGAQ